METDIKFIGNQYSQYGSSTFYKGLRITKYENAKSKSSAKANKSDDVCEDEQKHGTESISNSKMFVISMGDCIPVRPWHDSPIECLAEVRMIWRDKNEQSPLLSLRLYLLPENTSKGRVGHGEDELVAVNDLDAPKGRIVIRAEDFSSWLVEDLKWNWGLIASYNEKPLPKLTSSNGIPPSSLISNSKLDLSEVQNEKQKDGTLHSSVTVLSYSRYCRYRAALKRLEHIEDDQLRTNLIETLSGFVASQPNTRIMFAKESIDYPDLDSLDQLCPHLAPKLVGRPRGRRKKVTSRVSECSSPAPSSEFSVGDSCETNDSDVFEGKHLAKIKDSKTNQRFTRNKKKSESQSSEMYTTLSTGRVSKQRLPLTPLKSTTNKRRRKADLSEDEPESSSEDDQDEDYDDKRHRKLKQECGSKRNQQSKEDQIPEEASDIKPMQQQHHQAAQIPLDSSKSPEELEFLIRLNTFMAERSYAYPKLVWGLRDVNLFTIYTRVQKLGGFDAIADNRVWKNLFEDLSEPGKCITQGMTKRKYERILLPFERHERELRENGKYAKSELTISTIPKNSMNRKAAQSNQMPSKRRRSTSPAIEIIPLKNGAAENGELTLEQINEIQNMIKPKDFESQPVFNGSGCDGVPVHVIVRPTVNGSRRFENDKLPSSSHSFKASTSVASQQKPKEKENIPLMLQKHTTITPLTKDGVPSYLQGRDTVPSDDESHQNGSDRNVKKLKLDILREGGLEVTPISRRAQTDLSSSHQSSARSSSMQPNVSLMSLSPVRAPPVIQSLSMYQPTSQVFKNPKEEVISAARSSKTFCLDLTSSKHHPQQFTQHPPHAFPNPHHHQQQLPHMPRNSRMGHLSIEEVQRSYRGSNPDLQITLVKPHQEVPSSSSSAYKNSNEHHKFKPTANKRSKNIPSQSIPGVPPLNPVIIAAANELQKLQQQHQQQNATLFPFLSGLDITPLHHSPASASPKHTSSPPVPLDTSLISYLSALSSAYGNPLLQGNNLLSNTAVEFMKLYNNSSATVNRVPTSKN